MPGIKNTLHEFKEGTLHSGSKQGPLVKNRKQAIAIALSEERKAKGVGAVPLPSASRHPKTGRFVPHGSRFGYASNPPGSGPTT
jgi:hypothetical protein